MLLPSAPRCIRATPAAPSQGQAHTHNPKDSAGQTRLAEELMGHGLRFGRGSTERRHTSCRSERIADRADTFAARFVSSGRRSTWSRKPEGGARDQAGTRHWRNHLLDQPPDLPGGLPELVGPAGLGLERRRTNATRPDARCVQRCRSNMPRRSRLVSEFMVGLDGQSRLAARSGRRRPRALAALAGGIAAERPPGYSLAERRLARWGVQDHRGRHVA